MQQQQAQLDAIEQQLQELAEAQTGVSISGSPMASQGGLTPSQVYAMNVNSVVAISNQSTTNVWGQVSETAASGTGFIISPDGYILSNYHVVEGASRLTVITYLGDEYEARLVGFDEMNDVAILKRDTASMISIRASINGQYLNTYQADGLVISTPTGSTAYSLSNGGPIIVPGTKVFSMTAVAPHSLNVRPIVLADSSVIELDVESRSHSFLVAIDGRSEKCKEGTKLTLRRAPYDIQVVKRPDHRYFNALREKMMWGIDAR
jgi:S1-C subfamily serine protease